MIRRIALIILAFVLVYPVSAQLGGLYVYEFLELPLSTRASALGGGQIPILDRDINLAIKNPSLINPAMHNNMSLSFADYLIDINYGNVAYARNMKNDITALGSIQFIDYGDFDRADEFGNILGTFTAAEYAFNVGASKRLWDKYYFGAGLKFIYSTFEKYSSYGTALDFGATYRSPDSLFTSTLIVNNLGIQLKPYSEGNREPLPLNISLGMSKKFEYMPLRIVIMAHHLNKLDITYSDPNDDQEFTFANDQVRKDENELISEKIFRHFNFGGEFVFTKNFHIRFGYSHQRRKEMSIDQNKGLIGFSWGFGLRISKFHISYGNIIYHVAGGSNHFSITTNLSDFIRKGEK